ncbi:probable basic-leucine zipper transcription factor G [Mercenaria mercenaria]|uniref:probable basic-leucine zipper transcription factor G n=1 Tax=Mercenaria mercenaria TaxID=6596 RepID=UPI00234F47C6|nr:probable basic-leucine zipper transcription factor G [Mercenaria mercenaria]
MSPSGKKKNKKRKKGSSSGDEFVNLSKVYIVGGPLQDSKSKDQNKYVSEILNETNSILFNSSNNVFEDINSSDCSMSNHNITPEDNIKMASAPGSSTATSPAHHTPSNSDIMSVLKCLEVKLDKVESRLQKLDLVENKVLSFEKDLKLLTVQVHDSNKGFDQRMTDIDERVNRFEFISAEYQSRIDELERENLNLKDKSLFHEAYF